MSIEFTDEQKRALDIVVGWYRDVSSKEEVQTSQQYLTLGGFAGTGKSTLMGVLPKLLDSDPIEYATQPQLCAACGRGLSDEIAIKRGLGSDCYRVVKDLIQKKVEVAFNTEDLGSITDLLFHDLLLQVLYREPEETVWLLIWFIALARSGRPDGKQDVDRALLFLKTSGYVELSSHLAKPGMPKANRISIAFCAPTGKAAQVLRAKLIAADTPFDFCGTIHSLIKKPLLNEAGEVVGWDSQDSLSYALIIVDEASMVSAELWADLRYYDVPILAVGDHGQLPPVGSGLNLMADPMIKLETVHRQAADNPIIALATAVRMGKPLSTVPVDPQRLWYGQGRSALDSVVRMMTQGGFGLDKVILCHRNRTRVEINRDIRQLLGRTDPMPQIGDIVIGLKNTKIDDHRRLWNGQRGLTVRTFEAQPGEVWGPDGKVERTPDWKTGVEMRYGLEPDETLIVEANRLQFGRADTFKSIEDFAREARISAAAEKLKHIAQLGALMDYGFCCTTHKFQGSECDDVAVVMEKSIFRCEDPPDFATRWGYTALTRAKHRLAVVWL